MAVMDVAAAKREGYSDEEILTELQRRSGVKMDVMGAYKADYSVEEIAQEVDRRLALPPEVGTKKHERAEALRAQARNIETGSTAEGFLPNAAAFGRDLLTVGVDAGAGILDAAGGVQGLLSGGDMDNKLRRGAKMIQDFADKNIASPELRKERQAIDDEAETAGSDPNGGTAMRILKQAGARMKGLATNPLAAADFVGTQAGQLALPMGVARVAGKGAALMGANAAKIASVATKASVGAGASIQGGSVAGGTYDDLVSLPDETWEKLPEFNEKVAGGAAPQEAKKAIAEKYALVAGGVGALTSLFFNKGELTQTTERFFAGAGATTTEKSLLKRGLEAGKKIAAESLVSEPGDETTGQYAQNAVVGWVDPNRRLDEGIGDALGGAVLGGAAMGGPAAIGESIGGRTSERGAPSDKAPASPAPGSNLDGASLETPDPVTAANLAKKRQRIDDDFAAVINEKPHLEATIKAWRAENPLGETTDFASDVKAQEEAAAAEEAASHPAVVQAQQQADQAQATLEAAQQVASADPTQAPPGNLTPKQAQDALQNGTEKLEEAAHAAAENVRTQTQTVAKEATKESVADGAVEVAEGAQAQAVKDAGAILKESQAAMLAGSKPFDEKLLINQAVAAGMPEAAARDRAATVKKTIADKAAKENERGGKGEQGGSTPAGSPSATEEGAGATPASSSSIMHEAVTARGTRGQYRLRVVPLAALVSSDMAGYPAEVQPRDRSRFQANDTVRRIEKDLNPSLLMPTPSVTDGPPIIGTDYVVEGGNGRVMGIRGAARKGTKGWQDYQARVSDWAKQNGVDIAGVKDGVLVRERAFDVQDRAGFARELNESMTNSMDVSSQARSDANRMTPLMLGKIEVDTPSIRNMGDFLNAFIQALPEGERVALRDNKGAPSQVAVERAQAALFARAYGMNDSQAFRDILAGAFEEIDPDGMNIIAGLRNGAPALCFLEAGHDGAKYAFGEEIMEAAALVNDLRRRGVSLAEHLRVLKSDIFAHEIPDEVQMIAKTLTSMSRSARKIGTVIRSYADIAVAAEKGDILSTTAPTRTEAWIAAVQEVNHEARGQVIPEAPDEAPASGSGESPAEVPAEAEVEDAPAPRTPRLGQVAPSGQGDLFARLYSMLALDSLPKDNAHLRKIVAEEDGSDPSPNRMKEAQEIFESALATWARQTVLEDGPKLGDDILFANFVDVYERQPNLNIRTTGSLERQAYSTPIPLAFLAGRLGGFNSPDATIFEPTAGTGLLTICTPAANITANELDPFRAGLLASQGVRTFQGDARDVFLNGAIEEKSVDGVVSNPPFGVMKNPDGSPLKVEFDGHQFTHIDHLIVAKALRAMKDDGRACLIIAAERDNGSKFSPAHWVFQNWIHRRYNVVGHFEVDGELYRRQGAAWPVQVIVINGRAESDKRAPDPKTITRAMTWEDVHGEARKILDSTAFRRRGVPVGVPAADGRTGRPGGSAKPVRQPVGDGGAKGNSGHAGGDGGIAVQGGRGGRADVGGSTADPAAPHGRPGVAGEVRPVDQLGHEQGGTDDGQRGGGDDGGHQPAGDRGPASVAWGSGNKIVTPERAAALAAKLRDKLNPNRLCSLPMLDPELLTLGAQLAAFHIEAGARKFSEMARAVSDQLQMKVSALAPMLRQWYSAAQDYLEEHGGDTSGMDDREAATAALAAILQEEGEQEETPLAPVQEPPLAAPVVAPEPVKPADPPVEQVEAPVVQADPESLQTPYAPVSYAAPLDQGVLVPTSMAQALSDALYDIRNEVGPLDQFVSKELGLDGDFVRSEFMGTQVDGVAGAIYQAKRGKASIITDQTGVGKGRQAAAMIVWAIRNGRVPVFCTESAKLFTQMFTDDLASIGGDQIARPLILNSDGKILTADGNGVAVKTPENRVLSKIMENPEALEQEGYNCVFCTYSQFQNGGKKPGFLQRIASRAHLIMDEAHLAAGDSKRGEIFQTAVGKAASVTYLSATWAKRDDNMPVFSKTDIGDMKMTPEELRNAMVRGGYALQTTISQQLTRAGQLFRRERSWEGIKFEKSTDTEHRGEHEVIWDDVTARLQAIMAADDVFDTFLESYNPPSVIVSSEGSNLSHTDFANVVHNFTHQLALGIKAEVVAQKAIESLRKGEAPLIALESTMGSFLEEFAADNKLKEGDDVGGFSWRTFLHRGLERTRRVTITNQEGQRSEYIVQMNELDGPTYNAYRQAMDFIDGLDLDVPASPIDWIRHRIEEAGYKIGEFTGRKVRIDYTIPGAPVLRAQEDTKAEQVRIQREFNTGSIHVVILNVSGATGISLHADARWTDPNDPRPRVMFVAQAARDINVFMQILGRIHRTGQISLPRYELLSLDLPSETRPFAVLMKKMASLNANTSSRTEGHTTIEGVDLINRYGDYIVANFLSNNRDIAAGARVNVPDNISETNVIAGYAMKVTGRMAVAPIAIQRAFWDGITEEYNAYISYLTETGKNRLIKRTLDLRAQEVKRSTLHPGTGGMSAFAGPAHLVTYRVRVAGKPMSVEEANANIKERLGKSTPEEAWAEMLKKLNHRYERFAAGIKPSGRQALEKTREAVKNSPPPLIGTTVSTKLEGQDVTGVVLDVENETTESNPMARSRFSIKIATNNPNYRTIRMSLSRFDAVAQEALIPLEEALKYDGNATQNRDIIIGNLFAAYKQLQANVDTEIASFTLEDGSIQDGIILPANFDNETDVKSSFAVPNAEMAGKMLTAIQNTTDRRMETADGSVSVSLREDGGLDLKLKSGAKDAILKWSAALKLEFVKTGGRGAAARVQTGDVQRVFEELTRRDLVVSSVALREAGVLENGEIRPEAFDNPVNVFNNITPETITQAARIRKIENSYSHREALKDLAALQNRAVAMADLRDKIEEASEALEDGTITFRSLGWLKEIETRTGGKESGVDRTDAVRAANVCRFLARSAIAKKIEGKKLNVYMVAKDIEANRKLLDAALPWVDGDFYGDDAREAIKFAAWCFKEKKGFEPNLRSDPDVEEFLTFLSGEASLQSSKMAGIAALGLAAVGGTLAVASVGAMPVLLGGLTYLAANSIGSSLWNNFCKPLHTAKARIMAAGDKGAAVVENLDQVFYRTTEILARPAYLFNKLQKEASKAGLPMEDIGRLLADHVENGTPLPDELKEIGKHAKRILLHFEDRMKVVDIKTIEEYFPRRYIPEGLQELKRDPGAAQTLAAHIEEELGKADPQGVDEWARKLLLPRDRALTAMALSIIENIYDDSEESRAEVAKDRANKTHQWILEAMGGRVDPRVYSRVRDAMRHHVNPLTAQSLMKRKLKFQLPETWTLSDGKSVTLVDRNYFSVLPSYMASMSRSLAQRELLNKSLINGFLNEVGSPDNPKRLDLEEAIKNDLRGLTRPNLPEDDFDNPIARRLFQNPREAARRAKVANSILYLGLNVAYPMKNLLFGAPFAAGLTDLTTAAKASVVMARAMVPFARQAMIEDAAVAGALSSHIYDDVLNRSHMLGRIITFPMLYTQHAVDAAGFYAGRDYAPKVLAKATAEAARGQRGEFFGILQSALGRERALDVLAAGALTNADLDRFGLVYRNKISGTARNLNLPRFLDNELGKAAFQFSSIPLEQQKIYTDEISINGRRKAQFYTGAFVAGSLLCSLRLLWLLAKGDEDDDKELAWYLDGSMGGFLQKVAYATMSSGAFMKASPIMASVVGSPSGWKPKEAEMLASLAGVQFLTRGLSYVRASGEARKAMDKAREEGYGLVDQGVVGAMPFVRETLNGQTAFFRSMDAKVGKTEAEEELSGR